jgi:hypothetical protein
MSQSDTQQSIRDAIDAAFGKAVAIQERRVSDPDAALEALIDDLLPWVRFKALADSEAIATTGDPS